MNRELQKTKLTIAILDGSLTFTTTIPPSVAEKLVKWLEEVDGEDFILFGRRTFPASVEVIMDGVQFIVEEVSRNA